MQEWSQCKIVWEEPEYFAPEKDDQPAFTPEYVKNYRFEDDFREYPVEEGVTIYDVWCITGIHGSDEHFVQLYCVPSRDGMS
jgi:hypothetical protein